MKKPLKLPAEAPSVGPQHIPQREGVNAPVWASQRPAWPIWARRPDTCGACNNGLSNAEGDIDA